MRSGPSYERCATLWQCLVTAYDEGLRQDVGLAEYMVGLQVYKSEEDGYANVQPASRIALRLLIDVSWWVIITLILVNMISGIIIDSFAQLRDIDKGLRAQLDTKCIICESDASELNTRGSGYRRHIRDEHNLWNYLWLRLALRSKVHEVAESRLRETSPAGTTTATTSSPTAAAAAAAAAAGSSHPGNHPPAWPASPMPAVELSGQESYIWEMLQTDDRSYLPQGRALCLT